MFDEARPVEVWRKRAAKWLLGLLPRPGPVQQNEFWNPASLPAASRRSLHPGNGARALHALSESLAILANPSVAMEESPCSHPEERQLGVIYTIPPPGLIVPLSAGKRGTIIQGGDGRVPLRLKHAGILFLL